MEPKETIVERLRRIYGDIEPTLPATDSSPPAHMALSAM